MSENLYGDVAAGDEHENEESIEVLDVTEGATPKLRQKRRTRMRSKTIAPRRLTKEELKMRELFPVVEDLDRPASRGECMEGMRPCPYVSCKHHLYLDVNPETGSIKLNFPDKEIWELEYTCALDVAEKGGITLEEVGEIMNLTRERIRQVETRGLEKVRTATEAEPPRDANGRPLGDRTRR